MRAVVMYGPGDVRVDETERPTIAEPTGPGKTVAVVGDGAVGLLGVLAAKQLGASRIIATSRHADR